MDDGRDDSKPTLSLCAHARTSPSSTLVLHKGSGAVHVDGGFRQNCSHTTASVLAVKNTDSKNIMLLVQIID